ncbi:MAG: UDP-3-O-acyl-N-acetylglucosamine deacetylase [Hyphomonadaceae bacterium]|nr:UDP-3-O-acyl-N-acetylglucosamine deacetylase [Hyphomonadaceae bacterium]
MGAGFVIGRVIHATGECGATLDRSARRARGPWAAHRSRAPRRSVRRPGPLVTIGHSDCVERQCPPAYRTGWGRRSVPGERGNVGSVRVDRQHTISRPAVCAGVGVHLGARARMTVRPAPVDAGIVFVRADETARENRIPANAGLVGATNLGTTLRNAAGVEIATTEHFLAACAGLEIDNLIVEVDGPELPILDGSSAPFVQLLMNAGLKAQGAARQRLEILSPVAVSIGAKTARLEPADRAEFDVTIRYADAPIGVQQLRYYPSRAAFLDEIAGARTYGFLKDVEQLHAAGRGLGASYENTVVIDGGRVVNGEGLRFADEFVRHKILDAIGDLALAGGPILGRYVADQPGHALNALLIRTLFETPRAWRWTEAREAALTGSGLSAPSLAAAG